MRKYTRFSDRNERSSLLSARFGSLEMEGVGDQGEDFLAGFLSRATLLLRHLAPALFITEEGVGGMIPLFIVIETMDSVDECKANQSHP